MIPFFKWISDYYMHPIGEVIKAALPGGINLYDVTSVAITQKGEREVKKQMLSPLENQILSLLVSGNCLAKNLCKKLNPDIPKSLIQSLEVRGLITTRQELKGRGTKPNKEAYVSLIRSDIPQDRFFARRKEILDAIEAEGEISLRNLKNRIPGSAGSIKYLKDAGYIKVFEKVVYRDPFGEPIESDHAPSLTRDQKHVIDRLLTSLGHGFNAFLLAGVTGSGKTEVYMRIAAEAINQGYSVLVLVPEIALISQMERRFRARFGECVAVLHSGLSSGERYDQWIRILQKQAPIVIGARSAIFAPLENIGFIIVDEEHDTSYKQESKFRYNARDLAVIRGKFQHGQVVLGSATPSVQSYYNVKAKKFIELNLKRRANEQPLPEITVVDLRKNRDSRGIQRFITKPLYEAMSEALNRGEQILLFLNRRGFASFPICAECGEVLKCRNCEISLTLHRKANAYKCHFCGYSRASVSSCTICGSSKITLLGLGTEKIEAAVKGLFPGARVARMDHDTTTQKGSIIRILKRLRNRDIDILVGTQMIAKGHDFPNITLVGIICADLSLNFPDFRAGERTFQLLSQVAGRAGRGTAPGKVIMQTYNPDHFSIISARDQDFRTFYNKEIIYRKALRYPPFSRMIQLKISGKDREKTRLFSQAIGCQCAVLQKTDVSFAKSVEVLGPIEAPLSRIAKHYRWQILLKGSNLGALHQFAHRLLFENTLQSKSGHVKLGIDVDPFFML
jgi:primosomal protein N' (replication factor Y)